MASSKSRIPVNPNKVQVKRQRCSTQDKDSVKSGVITCTNNSVTQRYTFSKPTASRQPEKPSSTSTKTRQTSGFCRSRQASGKQGDEPDSNLVKTGNPCKTRFQTTINTKFGQKANEKEAVKRFTAKPKPVLG